MRGARECLELFPKRLLFRQMPQPPALEIVACEFANLQQESQVAALRRHPCAGSLKNFDDTLRTLIVVDRREHQQEVGRIGRRLGIVLRRLARARVGADQRALGPLEHLSQQATMLGLADRILNQPRLAQIDLIRKLQATRVGEGPDRPAGCRQRRDHLVQAAHRRTRPDRLPSERARRSPGRGSESPASRVRPRPRRPKRSTRTYGPNWRCENIRRSSLLSTAGRPATLIEINARTMNTTAR